MSPGVRYGGFWWRFLAFTIDTVPFTLAVFALTYLVFGLNILVYPAGKPPEGRWLFWERRALARDVAFVLYLAYAAVLEASPLQATLGKYLVGLRVVDADGRRLTWKRSLARSSAKILSRVAFFLGFVWVAFQREKRGWHDLTAGTFVVERNSVPVPSSADEPGDDIPIHRP